MTGSEADPHPTWLTRVSARPAAWSVVALLVALAVLGLRFLSVAGESYSYDEATYVDLADHPWRSAFYPDTVFLRHPPLYLAALSGWVQVAGDEEAVVRLPSLVFTAVGIALAWGALRRLGGDGSAAVGALLLGASFLVLVYGVQATMYPLGFMLAALGLWGHARRRAGVERVALTLLALTHLFGFAFVAAWIWQRRSEWRREAARFAPAFAWLAAAALVAIIGVAASGRPNGTSLGPLYQVSRFVEVFVDGRFGLHALAFAVSLLLLNPLLLRAAWANRHSWGAWGAGAALLLLALVTGPSFLRYGLLLAPVVLALGLPEFLRVRAPSRAVGAVLLLAAASATAGAVYVASGVDPSATNDLPGRIDWAHAATLVDAGLVARVATSAPTALAYYLMHDHGRVIVDSRDAPDRILLSSAEGHELEVLGVMTPDGLRHHGDDGVLLVVPHAWSDETDALLAAGYERCGSVPGADLLLRGGPCPVWDPDA